MTHDEIARFVHANPEQILPLTTILFASVEEARKALEEGDTRKAKAYLDGAMVSLDKRAAQLSKTR